jgi:hypothetical protein
MIVKLDQNAAAALVPELYSVFRAGDYRGAE